MTDSFRIAAILCFVVFVPFVLRFRLRAHTGEKLDRRQEGWFILVALRLAGLVAWGGFIAYMINPESLAWSAVPIPAWLRWSGVAFWAAAIALLSWTLTHLGRNLTDTVVTRKEHNLVTTGPYQWIRHPFYDCVVLLVAAMTLLTASWFLLLAGSLVFLLLAIRSRTEEANLLKRFGEPYQRYRDRTGRFLPRLG